MLDCYGHTVQSERGELQQLGFTTVNFRRNSQTRTGFQSKSVEYANVVEWPWELVYKPAEKASRNSINIMHLDDRKKGRLAAPTCPVSLRINQLNTQWIIVTKRVRAGESEWMSMFSRGFSELSPMEHWRHGPMGFPFLRRLGAPSVGRINFWIMDQQEKSIVES